MHTVLQGLQDRGLLTRPPTAPQGRALPTQLTIPGRQQLDAASTAVRAVEQQMLTALSPAHRRELLDHLAACTAALRAGDSEPSREVEHPS
jgi:DNA-binding MarR family transcriptional regulator